MSVVAFVIALHLTSVYAGTAGLKYQWREGFQEPQEGVVEGAEFNTTGPAYGVGWPGGIVRMEFYGLYS
jgi:hypothetical protein